MSLISKLDVALKAVCPIHGVSIGRETDRSTWRIDFKDEATAEQRAAAGDALAAFDPAVPSPEEQREQSLRDDAIASDLLARLRAATPTQLSDFVDNNVIDLASARTMFKRILIVLALVAKGE